MLAGTPDARAAPPQPPRLEEVLKTERVSWSALVHVPSDKAKKSSAAPPAALAIHLLMSL
jgi:hypothetical protein